MPAACGPAADPRRTGLDGVVGSHADEECDASPGYWRSYVLLMFPQEMNFGQLNGEPEQKHKKAKTVLAWAADCIDSDVLQEIERSQAEDFKKHGGAAEAELTQPEIEQFAGTRSSLDGWTRRTPEGVGFQADDRPPSVAAVSEGADSELEALEPPAAWQDGYEYYTLWETFGRVAQVFQEEERYKALADVRV